VDCAEGYQRLTSSPQGFLLWYFAIWPRNILLAAYFPTTPAMFLMFLAVWSIKGEYIDQSKEVGDADW